MCADDNLCRRDVVGKKKERKLMFNASALNMSQNDIQFKCMQNRSRGNSTSNSSSSGGDGDGDNDNDDDDEFTVS